MGHRRHSLTIQRLIRTRGTRRPVLGAHDRVGAARRFVFQSVIAAGTIKPGRADRMRIYEGGRKREVHAVVRDVDPFGPRAGLDGRGKAHDERR